MHTLSIIVNTTSWALIFKEKDRAETAAKSLEGFVNVQPFAQVQAGGRTLMLEDDYGQKVFLVSGAVQGFLLEDAEGAQEAVIQRYLHQQRTQVKAQGRARNDSTLKAAMMSAQMGAPSFTPFVNNGGPQN